MNSKTRLLLQVMMWFVCATHLVIGLGVNVSPQFVDTAARMYGAEPRAWSLEFLHILKPLGAFMIALGAVATLAALDPQRYRPIIYVFAGLFVLRAVHRLLFSQEIANAFGISSERSMSNMVFFFALAAVLIVLDQLANRTERASPAVA
jgi:hypothetical protein